VREETLNIVCTPTSFAAERLAREHGVPLATLDELDALDIAFDGADEVSPAFDLIKGRGAAHTREKVVASLAARFVVLIDPSKIVQQLGTKMPVPVEVLPMAVHPVELALERLGAQPVLRMGKSKDGPVVTDQGFWILDAHFNGISNPSAMNHSLLAIPGVLDHGLFIQLATDVLVGEPNGTVRTMQKEEEG
jgi:ribose 5-phosphate isomerase A